MKNIQAVLSALVTTTLTALQGSVHTHLAQRRFRQIYPRLRMTDELGTAQEATDAVATLQVWPLSEEHTWFSPQIDCI
jgi:hypothetical protein